MTNYIKVNYTGDQLILMPYTAEMLNSFAPKGCPFPNYTLLDLLKDLVQMYSWKISKDTTAADFIEMLMQEDAHAVAYGKEIIDLLEI